MGQVLDDQVIFMLNNMNQSAQNALLGTSLDNALAGVLPSGSIKTAELADGILSADAVGRLKMADGFVNASKEEVTPFTASATLTSAAALAGKDIVAAASVPTGKKIYILGWIINVSGATAWTDTTATKVTIQDTNGTPALAVDIAKAGLTGNAIISTIGGSNQTLGAGVSAGTGMTTGKGLRIKGDANFAAGSDIIATVFGIIK